MRALPANGTHPVRRYREVKGYAISYGHRVSVNELAYTDRCRFHTGFLCRPVPDNRTQSRQIEHNRWLISR